MNQLNIEQHFRPDEAPIISQIQDWINQSNDQYRLVITPFLNPRQRYIARTLVNRIGAIKMSAAGGKEDAEMQRLLFYPGYYQPNKDDFSLAFLEIIYPEKFAELHHRQIMGTLIGEGLERNTFGDILTDGENWQLVTTKQMAQFIQSRINHLGKIKVKWKEIPKEKLVIEKEDWETITTTVSSFRLDAVISAAYNYSRNRTKQIIERGLVQLNWQTMERPDYKIEEHDFLSVRHLGRIKIEEIGGTTRKKKQRITFSVIHA